MVLLLKILWSEDDLGKCLSMMLVCTFLPYSGLNEMISLARLRWDWRTPPGLVSWVEKWSLKICSSWYIYIYIYQLLHIIKSTATYYQINCCKYLISLWLVLRWQSAFGPLTAYALWRMVWSCSDCMITPSASTVLKLSITRLSWTPYPHARKIPWTIQYPLCTVFMPLKIVSSCSFVREENFVELDEPKSCNCFQIVASFTPSIIAISCPLNPYSMKYCICSC